MRTTRVSRRSSSVLEERIVAIIPCFHQGLRLVVFQIAFPIPQLPIYPNPDHLFLPFPLLLVLPGFCGGGGGGGERFVLTPEALNSLRLPMLVPQPTLTRLFPAGSLIVVPPAAPVPDVLAKDLVPLDTVLAGPEELPDLVPGPEAARSGLRGMARTLPESLAVLHNSGSPAAAAAAAGVV